MTWLWKGKKTKLDWRSYRGIVLVSTVGKAFEKVLLRRLQLWVAATHAVSHLQAVANGPLDGRHQTQLLYDLVLRRKTEKKQTVMAFADIGGAYPRTSRDILWRCLREKGLRGGMLDTVCSGSSRRTQCGSGCPQGCSLGRYIGQPAWRKVGCSRRCYSC